MKLSIKYLFIFVLTLGLVACGGDDDDNDSSDDPSTVFEIANESSTFDTLVAALEATGLDQVLSDPDATFTVFAPTDAAFELLGQDAINALLADPDTLSDILLYHVISGSAVDSNMAVMSAGGTIEMANGDNAALSLSGTDLYINLSEVETPDIVAENGVVHIIDAVMMPPSDPGTPTTNIVETAVADGNFTTLVAALQAAGLDTTLADESTQFTVFAPTDAAFALIDPEVLDLLLADTDALTAVLLQHVISGTAVDALTAYTLNGGMAETASGAIIGIDIVDGSLRVGGANVVISDIYTSNGIIHVVDAVIVGDLDLPVPPMSVVEVAQEAGSFTTLIAALEATGLDEVLDNDDGSFTVFAPTDDAFAELGQDTIDALLADTDTLSDILLYHVISGSEVMANAAINIAQSDDAFVEMANTDNVGLSLSGDDLLVNLSTVTTPNVMADNGVIHIVDKVLIPPAEMGTPTDNIVETAVAAGNFTTLVTALQAAGLDATLANEAETFTVFAPTDAAFALIPDETLTALLADVPALTNVLLQHVISGSAVDAVTAFTLNGTSVDTAAMEDVTIEIVDGVLEVQGSAVSTFDIYTTNGVIHVIDAVITETLE